MILSNILHMRRRIFFWSAAIVSAFLALVLLPGHEQRVYDLEDDYVWNEYGPVIGIGESRSFMDLSQMWCLSYNRQL